MSSFTYSVILATLDVQRCDTATEMVALLCAAFNARKGN